MQEKEYLYDLNVCFDFMGVSENKLRFSALSKQKVLSYLKMLANYASWSDEITFPISRNHTSIQMGLKQPENVVVTIDVFFSDIETFSAVEMVIETNNSLVKFLQENNKIKGFLDD